MAGSVFNISGVRRIIHTGLPRHSTIMRAPTSSLEISASTGAPNACVLALGFKERMNGVAAAAAPITPVTVVATERK